MPETPNRSINRISAFSVILIMIVLMVIGGAMVPLLKIQYTPSSSHTGFTISFSYPGASARVVEDEVTSKLEGVLNSIQGVVSMTATSWKGGGNVSLSFKKGTRMDAVRFEAATQIRQIYDKLPSGVSYPYINMSLGGGSSSVIMTYTINADLPPSLIVKYAEDNLLPPLSYIEGVGSVTLSGANPYEWVITFDPNITRAVGIATTDIASAFAAHIREDVAGSFEEEGQMHTIRLRNTGGTNLEDIPVKNSAGRIYYLRDIASVQYQESLPDNYFRINGLNAIYMNFYAEEGINTIDVANQIRATIAALDPSLPQNYTLNLTYDSSEALKKELRTIVFRSVLSLIILLIFVFVFSRSLRYLFVIGLTIVANLLIALIFYYVFGVKIHLYSLAGITVSLGIIIDASIVMIDHYSYYHNKRVFTSVMGAQLTTIAALLVIFFLPDEQKNNLVDFVWVIVINLSISVIIAFLFIPSLLEKMPVRRKGVVRTGIQGKRRIVKFSRRYERFILWSRRHRWIYITALVLGFGIPLHLLPAKVGSKENEDKPMVQLYNKTIGGTWYQGNKKIFETALGGSFRYFSKGYRPDMFFRQPEPRKTITINAGMPEGCTVHQLNDVMRAMENYLSQYDEIDMYQTRISGYNNGHITVNFKKEFENTGFPLMVREEIIRQVQTYGGANWSVYGIIEQGFNNYVGSSGYKSYGIRLTGYNYDMLYRYAEQLIELLSQNRRVSDSGIFADTRYSTPENEFYIGYDREKIARAGLNLGQYYGFLQQQLYNSNLGSLFDGEESHKVVLTSSEKDAFDLWHIQNDMVSVDTISTRLNDVGTITKQPSGNNIIRTNQEYQLVVGFNFLGPGELAQRTVENSVKTMNQEILPIGYKAERTSYSWLTRKDNWRQAGLLLLVIIIIYSLCAIIFESLRKPLVILLMIPVGFIGLFLTFAIGKFPFDQGGFASMIMMCGIIVNAGIYIVNEYNTIRRRHGAAPAVRVYVKAYNRKIVPTLLTIISTILGLIPFLFDGPDNVFWFAFAVGIMGSIAFSIIALVIYMPVFFPFRETVKTG